MFYVSENSLDDILNKVFHRLLSNNKQLNKVTNSTKGSNTEVFGALIELRNPNARLSRSQTKGKIFSALGELIWYLSSNNTIEFIEHYIPNYSEWSDDGEIANGAYGPRIFGRKNSNPSQFDRAIQKLKQNPESRNAVIQIFSNADAEIDSKDIPCTCSIQFVVRKKKLFMHTTMRSNDAFKGLPHDIFSFTMIQEIAARQLGCELGTYQHSVGSLHLYDDTSDDKPRSRAKTFLKEGFFEHIPMPEMPREDPRKSIKELIKAEKNIRTKTIDYKIPESLPHYWSDLIRLLQIYTGNKQKLPVRRLFTEYRNKMSDEAKVYEIYIRDRLEKKISQQPSFDF